MADSALDRLNQTQIELLQKYDDATNKFSEISGYFVNGKIAEAENALKLGGKNLDEIVDEIMDKIIPVGTIIEFMLIENGKKINFANDPIDERASSQGFQLFCPHSKEEYEKARQYLLSIKKPKAMGPLGIYYPSNGPGGSGWDMKNYALNSNELGSKGWKVQDGSPTWWAADTTSDPTFNTKPMNEPNGDYTAKAYLGIAYDDNGYIVSYNDGDSRYSYTTYLCVRRKK